MEFDMFPAQKPFHLILGFRIMRTAKIRITVYDPYTERVYAQRKVLLKKNISMTIKMPIAPQQLRTQIVSLQGHEDRKGGFLLEVIEVIPDTICPVDLTEKDCKFIAFVKWFATELFHLEAGIKGTIYSSEGFSILFLDELKEGGTVLTTPARIDRSSGMIEISKKAIEGYTVPMLIIMLLHEYCHKWKNPEYGKEVTNELTADIIAVHIALNLGFDYTEVRKCFHAVFSKKDTELNRKRMKAINEFIEISQKEEQEKIKTRKR